MRSPLVCIRSAALINLPWIPYIPGAGFPLESAFQTCPVLNVTKLGLKWVLDWLQL